MQSVGTEGEGLHGSSPGAAASPRVRPAVPGGVVLMSGGLPSPCWCRHSTAVVGATAATARLADSSPCLRSGAWVQRRHAVPVRPFSVLGGALAGALGRWLFSAVWGALDDQEPPESEHLLASWPKVLLASAVRGAIFAGVRAAVDRGSRLAFLNLTGSWPGERDAIPSRLWRLAEDERDDALGTRHLARLPGFAAMPLTCDRGGRPSRSPSAMCPGWDSNPHARSGQGLLRPPCLAYSITRATAPESTGPRAARARSARDALPQLWR